jgi:putative acetyltransferase
MHSLKRTNADDLDFQTLVKELDRDLALRDGEEHFFFAQFNKIDTIKYVVLVFNNEKAIACGAIKEHAESTMEIKRMFVLPDKRRKGIASMVLQELEKWAKESGCKKCILETGKRQPEAIGLYKKNHYEIIQNYGQYAGMESSVCFEKNLTGHAPG